MWTQRQEGGRLRRGVDPHSTNFLSFFFFWSLALSQSLPRILTWGQL